MKSPLYYLLDRDCQDIGFQGLDECLTLAISLRIPSRVMAQLLSTDKYSVSNVTVNNWMREIRERNQSVVNQSLTDFITRF